VIGITAASWKKVDGGYFVEP